MIRQMCPHCVRLIELPDAAAGTDAACLQCGKTFPVPGAYHPAVEPAPAPTTVPEPPRPAPPPGLVPPTPTAPTAGAPAGYERSAGFALLPQVIDWIPAGCLTLVLLLSLFAWVGTYPGGTGVYTQSPWGAAVRGYSIGTLSDDLLKDEPSVRANMSMSWLLWPYLLLLLAAVVLVWGERVVGRNKSGPPASVPALAGVWPLRFAVLGGLAALLLLLLVFQSWRGFGLERAIQRTADQRVEDFLAVQYAGKELPTGEAAKNRVEVLKGQEFARFAVQGTSAFHLAMAAHFVAVLGLAAAWWLDRRGTKPPPRVALYW